MNGNELITLPNPEYSLNQQINYKRQLHTITARFYDPDKQQWFYSINTCQSLITKEEVTAWWVQSFA